MSKSTRSVLTYPTGTIQIQYLQTLRENMPVFSVKKNKTHLAVKFDFICDIKLVFQQQLEIWGKAQRESTHRPKSNCGKNSGS